MIHFSYHSHERFGLLVGLLIAIVILGVAIGGMNGYFQGFLTGSSSPIVSTTPLASSKNSSSSVLIYGNWTANNSVIKAFAIEIGKTYLLAELPKNIKKVQVLTPDTLIFINNTDDKDHGSEIVTYSLRTKQPTTILKADIGFGVDDYKLSPNGKYLAAWEVQFAPNVSQLNGGQSKVTVTDLSYPTVKHLIYDETATAPVHYPLAVTNDGRIFCDLFLPNSGAGWGYGMSVSDVTGTTKQNITSMVNGTYGTQPALSPDGMYLAFAGYDGSLGNGTATLSGFRQALVFPNTVELLDTTTLQRIKLPNLSNQNIYTSVHYDKQTGNLLTTQLSNKTAGNYLYDIAAQKVTTLPTRTESVLSSLSGGIMLLGTQDASQSTFGNLGEGYGSSYTQFSLLFLTTGTTTPLSLADNFMQYITLFPANTFSQSLLSSLQTNNQQLQLAAFDLKPSLQVQRTSQQSDPLPTLGPNTFCRDICKALLGPSANRAELDSCTIAHEKDQSNPCYDSPLYLSGPARTHVTVKVNTPLFSSSVPYENGYAITLNGKGGMVIVGKTYQSISYGYIPAKRFSPPTQGIITIKEDIINTLSFFAKHLGLNQKETADLVTYGATHITSPYVFVSFFDEQTSEQILPISFSPHPDTYRNIVFYFKEYRDKPTFVPHSPVFPPIVPRGVFSAIEISEVVK